MREMKMILPLLKNLKMMKLRIKSKLIYKQNIIQPQQNKKRQQMPLNHWLKFKVFLMNL